MMLDRCQPAGIEGHGEQRALVRVYQRRLQWRIQLPRKPNIWNLLAPNPSTTPADHQTPIVGRTNYAYVYVSNRGTQPASNVVVSGYHCRPSAGLLWPDDWQPMTTASITVPGTIFPGAVALVGPFQWTHATLVQDVDGFLRKWVRLQVPRDREVEARELLEELLQPPQGWQ